MPHVPIVLCIDRGLNCSAGDLPPHARIVWFQKRIEPSAVMAAIEATTTLASHVELIGLGDLFIDWAGRYPATAPIHRRLASLAVGDVVRLRKDGPHIAIEATGEPVAMLSRQGCARWAARLDQVVSVKLVEKVERRVVQSTRQWHDGLQCEHWTVPIVEVTVATAPADPPPATTGRPCHSCGSRSACRRL